MARPFITDTLSVGFRSSPPCPCQPWLLLQPPRAAKCPGQASPHPPWPSARPSPPPGLCPGLFLCQELLTCFSCSFPQGTIFSPVGWALSRPCLPGPSLTSWGEADWQVPVLDMLPSHQAPCAPAASTDTVAPMGSPYCTAHLGSGSCPHRIHKTLQSTTHFGGGDRIAVSESVAV